MRDGYDNSDERIQRQLERQRLAAGGGQPPLNTTQPVGVGAPVAPPPLAAPPNRVPGQEGYGFGNNADGTPGLNNAGQPALPPSVNPPAGATSMPPNGPAGSADLAWRKTLAYGGGPGQLNGFNTTGQGYDDKAANSVKNTAGRILQRYPSTPEGLTQAVNDPDFQRAFPNARLVPGGAGDKIDFGGVLSDFESGVPVGVVDVGQSFDPRNNTGAGWRWGHDDGGPSEAGGGGGVASSSSGGGIGMDLTSILAGTDPMDDILKRIQDLQGGQTPDAERKELQRLMRGGG